MFLVHLFVLRQGDLWWSVDVLQSWTNCTAISLVYDAFLLMVIPPVFLCTNVFPIKVCNFLDTLSFSSVVQDKALGCCKVEEPFLGSISKFIINDSNDGSEDWWTKRGYLPYMGTSDIAKILPVWGNIVHIPHQSSLSHQILTVCIQYVLFIFLLLFWHKIWELFSYVYYIFFIDYGWTYAGFLK